MSSPVPKNTNPIVRFLAQRWLTIVLVVIAIIFIAQNRDHTKLNFLWMELSGPLWLFLAVLFLGGLIAGAATFKRRAKAKAAKAAKAASQS